MTVKASAPVRYTVAITFEADRLDDAYTLHDNVKSSLNDFKNAKGSLKIVHVTLNRKYRKETP